MFCPNCGSDCKDGAFCDNCGTSLGGPVAVKEKKPFNFSKKNWIILGAIVVATVLLIVLLCTVGGGGGSGSHTKLVEKYFSELQNNNPQGVYKLFFSPYLKSWETQYGLDAEEALRACGVTAADYGRKASSINILSEEPWADYNITLFEAFYGDVFRSNTPTVLNCPVRVIFDDGAVAIYNFSLVKDGGGWYIIMID